MGFIPQDEHFGLLPAFFLSYSVSNLSGNSMGLAFKTHPNLTPFSTARGSCPSHFPRALRRFGDRSQVICSTPPQISPFGRARGQSPQAGPPVRTPAALGSPCCPPVVPAAVPEQPGGLLERPSCLPVPPPGSLPSTARLRWLRWGSGGSGGLPGHHLSNRSCWLLP